MRLNELKVGTTAEPARTITAAVVEVIELDPVRRRARLATTCTDPEQPTVVDGEALLPMPD